MQRVSVNKPQPLDGESKKEQDRVLVAFGSHLRQLRHDRVLPVEQVAENAGLHPNYLSSVERGERNVSLYNIWRIAAGLGLSSTELVAGLPHRKVKPAKPKQPTR